MIEPMPRELPKYVTREKTRHGRTVFYFRKERGGARIRLPDDLGSDEFWQAYAAAIGHKTARMPARAVSGTLEWLVARYQESAAWASLAEGTRVARGHILKGVMRNNPGVQFAAITQAHIRQGMQDRKPNPANHFLKAMTGLFAFAVSLDLVKESPCAGLKQFRQECQHR